MTGADRERLILEPLADDPGVGRWLAALEDARRDTLAELRGVTPEHRSHVAWLRDTFPKS